MVQIVLNKWNHPIIRIVHGVKCVVHWRTFIFLIKKLHTFKNLNKKLNFLVSYIYNKVKGKKRFHKKVTTY